MSKNKTNIDEICEIGTTNVFADLDMPDAEEKLVKAEFAFKINQILKRKKIQQVDAAKLLKADRHSLQKFIAQLSDINP